MFSEIASGLRRRGVSPAADSEMVVDMKTAVCRLCASDVVCARIVENEMRHLSKIECASLLHKLTGGKVLSNLVLLLCTSVAKRYTSRSYRVAQK